MMTTTNTGTAVANTILGQIRSIDRWALGSWGCTGFGKCVPVATDNGVILGCNGRKVVVTLAADDTYTIEVGRVVKLAWKVSKRVEGIFAEDLVRVIDTMLGR